MGDLLSGGAGTNGILKLTADDGQVAATMTTQGSTAPAVAAPAAPGRPGRPLPPGVSGAVIPGGAGVIIDPHAVVTNPADTFELGHQGRGGIITLKGASNEVAARLAAGDAGLPTVFSLGSASYPGQFVLRSRNNGTAFGITLPNGFVQVDIGEQGRVGTLRMFDSQGRQRVALDATLGQIFLTDENSVHKVIIDGAQGDVVLNNADVAEEFDVADDVEPGCVVRIGTNGRLERTDRPFDSSVAGVVSGFGGYKPGIVLDRQKTNSRRLPVAMLGKVNCLADATRGPIRAGSLLTSSHISGHAMAIADPREAAGAIIGKALGDLLAGQGRIPMLVALR